MNWFKLLLPILLSILEKWLQSKDPTLPILARAGHTQFMTDAECDEAAKGLKAVLDAAPPPLAAGPATHEGGVLAHLQELYAALTAVPRDWVLIRTLLLDLLQHL